MSSAEQKVEAPPAEEKKEKKETKKRKKPISDIPEIPVEVLTDRPRRERKPVDHYTIVPSRVQVEFVARKGKGKKLGDIPNIETRLGFYTKKDDVLKKLHRVLYPSQSVQELTLKSHIREFSGFVFEDEKEDAEKIKNKLRGYENAVLKSISELLDMEVSGTKEQLVDRILEFLVKPYATDKAEPTKKSKSKKSSSKSSSKSGSSKPLTAFMIFSKDNRSRIKDENPDASFGELSKLVGEEWRNLDSKTKKKYEDKAAAAADGASSRSKSPAKKKAKTTKSSSKSKSKKAESKEETDDEDTEDEDDEAGQKKELTAAIRKIIEEAEDKKNLTAKMVRSKLAEVTDTEIMTKYKTFIASTISAEYEKAT